MVPDPCPPNLGHHQSASVQEMKENMEKKVTQIVEAYKAAFALRCSSSFLNCDVKSFNLCQGSAQKECIEDFPIKNDCIGYGAYLAEHTGFRYPNNVPIDQFNQQEIQFVCTSATIEKVFQKISTQRNKVFTYAYIGDIYGGIRIYPSSIDAAAYGCRDYDSRLRPWFNIAASVEKDIVIVLDRSKYMSQGKLQLGIVGAKAIIATLSHKDHFSVVLFDTKTEVMVSNNLAQANTKNIENYRYNLDYILPTNRGTNLQTAFAKSFSVLKKKGTNCPNRQKILFLITSGKNQKGKKDDSLISYIASLNTINAKIFIFSENQLEDNSVFQEIACENGGILFQKEKVLMMESEVLTNIMGFFEYLVYKIPSDETPVWTEPYIDAFGFGELVTVSQPIFYEEGSIRKFIGVAAFDVKFSVFEQKGMSRWKIIKLLSSNRYCYDTAIPECQKQTFRPMECNITQNCTGVSFEITPCLGSFSNNFTMVPQTVQPKECCFLSISELMAVLFGFSVVVFIVVLVFWWRHKKKLKRLQKQRKKLKKLKEKRMTMSKKKQDEQEQISEVEALNLSMKRVVSDKEEPSERNAL